MTNPYPTLDEIGVRTGTDQSSLFHDYCRTMAEILAPLRHEPIVFLEQGVLGGAGLRMWAEYFTHPKARIIGLDIEPFRCEPILDERVLIVSGSQTKESLLHRICEQYGQLDCCCDDASHFASAQQAAFRIVWPMIKPGGYWICQDLHTYAAPELCDAKENVMQWLTRIATEMQGRGAKASGKVEPTDQWADLDTITFRKGLAVFRKSR